MDEEPSGSNHHEDGEVSKEMEVDLKAASDENNLDDKLLDEGDEHVVDEDNNNEDDDKSTGDHQEDCDHNAEGLDDGPNEFECHKEEDEKDRDQKCEKEKQEVNKKDDGKEADKDSAKKDWVAIVEADEGKLYTELQKIGKLISRQQKVNEIKRRAKKHRMRVFPVTLDELNTPYMRSVLEMCSQVHMKWVTKRTDNGVIMNGILEMTFAKLKDAEEQKKKLKDFKKDISVWDNYDNSHEEETNRKFNKMAGIPVDADANNKLTLLSPSLPTSVTEEELWQLFPNAREIWLITGGKRHHAYLKFLDEDTLQKTLAKLREQGPPREDFNFCRLVRYYEVEHAIKYTRSGGSRRSDHHRSRSPHQERHSSLSHSHSSRSDTSDRKKTEHKSKSSSGDANKSSSKSEAKSDSVDAGKAQSFTSSAFDTDDKKAESKGMSPVKSTVGEDESKYNKKDSKSDSGESKSDDTDSKSKPKGDAKDTKSERSESKLVKRKTSDHSKTSRSRSETKSVSRPAASRHHRSRDRSGSRSRSRGRIDRLRRFDARRRPIQKKILTPLRKRDHSPRRMKRSSLLGPPPGSVPSLLAPGPLPNVPMMMGRPFENVLSQLQPPSLQQPMMAPQAQQQQGLQVLDNLLSTIGKLSNQSSNMPSIMHGEDSYGKRPVLHRRSRSRSPLGRGHSPMRSYDEPNKRLHMMDNVRDKVYSQDSFGSSHHDNYTRGGSDTFRSHDFGRNDDYLPGGRHDDYGRYNQQFGQGVDTNRSYTAGRMTGQGPNRDTYDDQRSFPCSDAVRMGRPIDTVRPSDLSQVKKDTATLEGEYALMMNQIGQTQQRGPMGNVYRPDYY